MTFRSTDALGWASGSLGKAAVGAACCNKAVALEDNRMAVEVEEVGNCCWTAYHLFET